MSLGTSSGGLMPNSQTITLHSDSQTEIRQQQKKGQKLSGTGLCEKCSSCIIDQESCNPSIRVSACVRLCVQSLIMPRTHKTRFYSADAAGAARPNGAMSRARFSPVLWKCVDEARCSASLVDAFYCQKKKQKKQKQKKKQKTKLWLYFSTSSWAEVTEIPLLTADVPDQFKRLSA